MVWSLSRSTRVSGSVVMPVESAMRTRRFNKSARNTGRTRSGFDPTFNSSRFSQTARTGGKAPRKLAEMSRARRLRAICGRVEVRKEGTELGVVDDPIRRCVVPVEKAEIFSKLRRTKELSKKAHLVGFEFEKRGHCHLG